MSSVRPGAWGRCLIRAMHSMDGARVVGAIERPGSPYLGRDAGELAGIGTINVAVTDDPLPVFAKADGVLDFSVPAASVEFAGLCRAGADRACDRHHRLHGSRRCKDRGGGAARHDRQVRQYEPRRQSSGGAGRTGGPRARCCGFRHRDPRNAPQAQGRCAIGHGAAARPGRRCRARHPARRQRRARARRPHRRAARRQRSALPHCAAAPSSATIR